MRRRKAKQLRLIAISVALLSLSFFFLINALSFAMRPWPLQPLAEQQKILQVVRQSFTTYVYLSTYTNSYGQVATSSFSQTSTSSTTIQTTITVTPTASSTSSSTSAGSTTSTAKPWYAKGLYILSSKIVYNSSIPSLQKFAQDGFTTIGTDLEDPNYNGAQLSTITSYFTAAHSFGLNTFIMVFGSYSGIMALLPDVLSSGADILMLDDPFSRGFTVAQVQSIVATFSKIVVINEYQLSTLDLAYQVASANPQVFVASDNYNVLYAIDYNINLANQNARHAITWLMFVPEPVSNPPDCYVNLASWISYVKQRNTGVFFYYINSYSGWVPNWGQVEAF